MVTTKAHESLLRDAGLRVTRPRMAVLDAVRRHPHADTESIIELLHRDMGPVSRYLGPWVPARAVS